MTPHVRDHVDAAPVREHVLKLKRMGMSNVEIARAAGVSKHRISSLLIGHKGVTLQAMEPVSAAALLAVDLNTIEPESAWKSSAACASEAAWIIADQYGAAAPADLYYPPESATEEQVELFELAAVALCERCPVRVQCDDYAATETVGVWAGRDRAKETA